MVIRQVFGSKCCVPVPLECAILKLPPGKSTVSTLLPEWSTPGAVNTPLAIMDDVGEVAEVVMSWKFSVPLTPVWVLAAASPAPPITAAVAAAVTAEARILRIAGSPSGAIAAGVECHGCGGPASVCQCRPACGEPVCPHIGSDAYSGLR